MARAEVRRKRWGILGMGVIIGLAAAFTLTAAIGAKRAATSWDRFSAATESPDAVITAPSLSAGDAVLAIAKSTPGVRAATGLHWLPVAPSGIPVNSIMTFVAIDDSMGRTIYRPRVLEGRLADQARAEDVVINKVLADVVDLHPGDPMILDALDDDFTPIGPLDQELTIVGVVEGTGDLGENAGTGSVYLTSAFRDRWLPELLEAPADLDKPFDVPVFIVVEDGTEVTEVAEAIVVASPPGTRADVGSLERPVQTTIDYATWALVVLAAGAAIATLVVAAQTTSRLVQPRLAEEQAWGALGATNRQRTVALAAPPVAALVVALVVAVGVAIVSTPLVPTGFPRRVEIDPGIWVDPAILVGGVLLLAVALGMLAIVFAAAGRRRIRSGVVTASPSWLGLGSPARALGVRAALGRGTTAASRRRARSAIAAGLVAIVGIGAMAVVASASDGVLDSPRAWGFGFDRYVGLFDESQADAVEHQVSTDSRVSGLSIVETSVADVEDTEIELQQIDPRRGSALPVLLDGMPPIAPDEVVLGPLLLRDHDLGVGDTVELVAGAPPARIVGVAAIPGLEGGEFGSVGWVGPGAFDHLGVAAGGRYLYLEAAPGVDAAELDGFGPVDRPFLPPSLRNLREIGTAPYLLAAFLGLLGLASLAHALLVAVRGRRHDLAVLRSLGFRRRQVHGTVAWQAVATAVVGLVVGLPVGLMIGAWIWRRIASALGTPVDIPLPYAGLALVIVGTLVAAGAVAMVPAWRAGRIRPAEVLRTE
jgi:hypothetical protein